MPKPSPAPSKDQHGHDIERLPGGGEIIPEHFHEGRAAARHFSQTVRDVLSVPRAVVEKQHAALQKKRKRQRARAAR